MGQTTETLMGRKKRRRKKMYLLEELRRLVVEVDGQRWLSLPVLNDLWHTHSNKETKSTRLLPFCHLVLGDAPS